MQNSLLQRDRPWLVGAFIISLAAYVILIYLTPREDFYSLLFLFTLLGLCYLLVVRSGDENNFPWLLAAAVILRLSLMGAVPQLSDDYFRFIWDGKLWNEGINPFANLPSELITRPQFEAEQIYQKLYAGLNSRDYFTIYPPLSQLVFVISTKLFPQSIVANVVTMRAVLLAMEIGTLLLLPKVLSAFKLPSRYTLIYAWNPLVIIELTGNLHFEAMMIFFLVLTLWFWKKGLWWGSAVCLGLAVSTKLLPLIFLPLLWDRLPLKLLLAYGILMTATIAVCFWPLLDAGLYQGMSSSLSLYFQKFEFNASLYYLIREIGYAVKGWNIIGTAGKYLALTTFLAILSLAWWTPRSISWPQAMMWALSLYLLLATTVHPWYVTTLVVLSIFTRFRFALVWSFTVFVSYAGYTSDGYTENLALTLMEYVIVGGYLIYEWRSEWLRKNLIPPDRVN